MDYFILEIAITDGMYAADPWGRLWFPEIYTWCNATFGKEDMWGAQPITGWKRMRNTYFFTSEEMMCMFKLRWE